MRISIRVVVGLLAVLYCSCGKKSPDDANRKPDPPIAEGQPVYQADPTIFPYQGKYYLYGTDGAAPDQGIRVFVAPDKKQWKLSSRSADGFAVRALESFGTRGFWAPQVWAANSKFYMAYVANEQIAIAAADSPEGPFYAREPLAFDQKNIDPYVFFDEDGKKYLYHVDITNGNKIYVASINDAFTAIDKQSRKLCITATDPWEIIQARVAEGPTVIKHKGIYYLVYSANHFENQRYAVGYATAASPWGPWTKAAENPVLSMTNTGKPGSGHGDLFTDPDGSMYYVFHTHNSMNNILPRRTALVKASFVANPGGPDKLVMDVGSLYYLQTTP
ncbi:glycoside hydrolase family 43 protein [Niabella pedocola]|uniref:Glycoside hydrolase family 43 protein n=1 Tax=Niabella pedocola TaxID=1752077 RepID=A0ABS8PYH0_9BACT|nr:glycoside hydrolase family 43 protein [Niabella pedocola]MCD2425378.1 glycoside hydrolase family 43 protein [Niabella pedocola]